MRKGNYNCFSKNQMKFLLEGGQVPIHVMVHDETKRTFWIYERNEILDDLLNKWSENKL